MNTNVSKRAALSTVERMDRLPISSFHYEMTAVLGMVVFFDFASTNTFSFVAPAIMKLWHLSISQIAFITSATFVGMWIGAMVGGAISDRFGRKRALILTATWFAFFSLLNALVNGTATLFVARLLTGIGISAMTVVGMTYVSEMFPSKRRGAFQGWVMTIGLCGIPVTAYVARLVIPMVSWGWRLVFIWGALGLVFALLALRLEESPRWYESQGRWDDAENALTRIERRVQKSTGRDLAPLVITENLSSEHKLRYRDVIAPTYIRPTLVLGLAWIFQTIGFFSFTAFVPTLLVAHGFSLVRSLAWSSAMSIATVPGALLAALVSDKWDRRWWITLVALLIGAAGCLYGFTFKAATIIIFGFTVELLLHTFNPLLYAYTAECYPTDIRNSGTGLTYGAGRLSNVFGPIIVATVFNRFGYTSVFIYITCTWAMVALVVGLFGLRSRHLAVSQTFR
jgi:putative MFS transporter